MGQEYTMIASLPFKRELCTEKKKNLGLANGFANNNKTSRTFPLNRF